MFQQKILTFPVTGVKLSFFIPLVPILLVCLPIFVSGMLFNEALHRLSKKKKSDLANKNTEALNSIVDGILQGLVNSNNVTLEAKTMKTIIVESIIDVDGEN
jgi:hypothetical protein